MGHEAKQFALINNLSQLIGLHIYIPGRPDDRADTLGLILAPVPFSS